MTRMESLNSFFMERLMSVAGEIFLAVKDIVSEYQEEIKRTKQENRRLRQKLTELNISISCEKQTPEQHNFTKARLDSETSVIHMKLELASVKQEAEPQHLTTDVSSFSDTHPSHVDGLPPVHQNSSLELQDSKASLTQVKLELAEGNVHHKHLQTENLAYGKELPQPILLDVLDMERKRDDHLQGNSSITAQLESCNRQVTRDNTNSSAPQIQSVQGNHLDTMKLESGVWFRPYCEQISEKVFTATACSQNRSASNSFMCDRCGKLYRCAWLLKKHLVTHGKAP